MASISSGSIGKALLYSDNMALRYYEDLCKLIYAKDKFKLADLLSYVDTTTKDEESFALVQELILKFISENIANSSHTEELADAWENAIKMFNETSRLNLDKKQILINIVYELSKAV